MKKQYLSRTYVGGAAYCEQGLGRYLYGGIGATLYTMMYHVSAYPVTSLTKYGQQLLGSSSATLSVTLEPGASGEPIDKYPLHPLVSASAALTSQKIVTITGLDFYREPHETSFVLSAGGSEWYSPVEFSRIDSISVVDDGADDGKLLKFGDGAGSGPLGPPLFGLPTDYINIEPGYDALARNSAEEEWFFATHGTDYLLSTDLSVGRPRGAIRFYYLFSLPNGVRESLIIYNSASGLE